MKPEERKLIKVGSRKSELALIQTKHVIKQLQMLNPAIKYEIHTMTTLGDRVLNKSLPKIGEKSLFTKDLEDALCKGGVDFVVHSLKDLPTSLPAGMAIGAVLEREDPRDALVLNEKYKGKKLESLPENAVIGTSSLRRTAQLRRLYPHLNVLDIRGNLNTRLAKLDAPQSKFAAIILAQAGLQRMGWQKRIDQVLDDTELLYAVGQGALAVECRGDDDFILNMLAKLCHAQTQYRILAERSFLKTLGGGCSAPVAVCSQLEEIQGVKLMLKGAVWSLDGCTKIEDNSSCTLHYEEEIPFKRAKLANDNEGNALKQSLSSPPKVISDAGSSSSSFGGGEPVNVSELIKIHGDLFKKCPYAAKMGDESSSCSASKESIGQEVLGDCPIFKNTEEKIKALDQLDNSIQIEKDVVQCPMLRSEREVKGTGNKESSIQDVTKCPFLEKKHEEITIVEFDNDHTLQEGTQMTKKPMVLYCGLYCPKSLDKKTFEACEQLGRALANKLIDKGALTVMKCAQDEVHNKI